MSAKLLLLLLAACTAMLAQQYDLLLQGGTVIDPKNNLEAVRDVAIQGGRIAAVEANIPARRARRVVPAGGLYVTPGLIDLHTHLYHTVANPGAWAGSSSIPPDTLSFRTGVTTMVDAGSAGWRNFEMFRTSVIDTARTRVLALINIAGFGMISDMTEQGDFNAEAVARLAKKHSDVVVGVKSAHYQLPDWKSVEEAVSAGKAAQIPIMVDFGFFLKERPYWQLVTEKLRSGDISTHCFRGPVPWVNADGKLYAYVSRARERGVRFDVGHGGGSFVLRNAVPAVRQGFYPDSISTDLHTGSMNDAMMDMPTTMSKFLAMGMPLKEAILRSTWNPAQMIKRPELGHLTVGAPADVAVWRVLEGRFGYGDVGGGRLEGNQRLICELTLRNGRIVWDWNFATGDDFTKLPSDYGIRKGTDLILPPPGEN
jgi:dihydroorotase